MFLQIGVSLLMFWCLELIGYLILTPDLARASVHDRPVLRHLGTVVYGVAYALSLLRAPLGLLPYLVKVWLTLVFKLRYEARRTTYAREVLNMVSEIVNLTATWVLLRLLVGPVCLQWFIVLCYIPVWAECIRLLAERIPILFSSAWQLIPHRWIACFLQYRLRSNYSWKVLERYCHYYSLSDAERAILILEVLKQRACTDPEVATRLAYLQAFRIVPQQQGLRGGLVRDVARGEVFIHAIWTNDPWLLIGMALRRSPWPFDPRYLRRPFYYMSEANRITSLFVLRNARYSLPYALFQFGHEIRVVRLHCFYTLLRWSGADIERKVWADGTFQNDQCISWLKQCFSRGALLAEPRALYCDEEVLVEQVPKLASGAWPSTQEIAELYVYPLTYVEEVLLPRLMQKQEECQNALSTTRSFSSHT